MFYSLRFRKKILNILLIFPAELEAMRHQTAFIQNASSTNLGAMGSPLNNNGMYNLNNIKNKYIVCVLVLLGVSCWADWLNDRPNGYFSI